MEKYKTLTVEELIEHEDGSATLRMDMDMDIVEVLVKEGLEEARELMTKEHSDFRIDNNEYELEYTLSNEELDLLMHMGFIRGIRIGLTKLEAEDGMAQN